MASRWIHSDQASSLSTSPFPQYHAGASLEQLVKETSFCFKLLLVSVLVTAVVIAASKGQSLMLEIPKNPSVVVSISVAPVLSGEQRWENQWSLLAIKKIRRRMINQGTQCPSLVLCTLEYTCAKN